MQSVKAPGTAEPLATRMHATPVNDFDNTDVHINPNGRVRHKMYIWHVKAPDESKYKCDFYKAVATKDGKDSSCPICSVSRPRGSDTHRRHLHTNRSGATLRYRHLTGTLKRCRSRSNIAACEAMNRAPIRRGT